MTVFEPKEVTLIEEAERLLLEEYEANEAFNESFDAGQPVTIGIRDYRRSKALYWLDRPAYIDAKVSWLNDSLQEQHDLNSSNKCNAHLPPFTRT